VPKNRSRDLIRVGDRDGWVCGICRDPARPVHRPLGPVAISAGDLTLEDVPAGTLVDEQWEDAELARRRYDPLAASIDHILPRSRGGTDDDSNLQITHLRCNLLKHDQAQPPPEYARARLSLTLDGTPVPYGVWRRAVPLPRRGTPARRAGGLPPAWMIERGQVAVEPWRLIIRYRVWRMLRRHRQRRQAARDALS
jgi:hypothetical protein